MLCCSASGTHRGRHQELAHYVQVRQSLEQFASKSGGAGSKPDVLQEHVVVRPHPPCARASSCVAIN